MTSGSRDDMTRLTVLVSGRVQGVGFRYWVRRHAEPLGLRGSATNLPDGRVEVIAEGPGSACDALLAALRRDGTPGTVTGMDERWSDPLAEQTGFRVR